MEIKPEQIVRITTKNGLEFDIKHEDNFHIEDYCKHNIKEETFNEINGYVLYGSDSFEQSHFIPLDAIASISFR